MITPYEERERFELEERIGSGGMGVVYRARDRETGARVALKLLDTDSPELGERFIAEAKALAALDHPGIVRLIAHGGGRDGRPFLAMEWLAGEDLAKRLERGGLGQQKATILGKRVAEALSVAHNLGVIHRDIKPSNIFLVDGEIERAKIVDFGVARLVPAQRITVTGAVIGTPAYMAPEQARGAKQLDARADLFSLGAVLFECVTGERAFVGEHAMAVLAKLLLDEPPRLRALRSQLAPALARLLDRLMAKDPSARPPDAAAVARELEAVARELSGTNAPPPRLLPEPSPSKRLTGSEQRLVTILIATPSPRAGASEAPHGAKAFTPGPGSAELRRLEEALSPLGGRVDPLLEGTLLVTFAGAVEPAEQAARAARGALLLRRSLPEAAMAIVGGLHDTSESSLVGQVVDRAAALLAPATEAVIRLDVVVARLLDLRFQVIEGAAGIELVGERDVGQGARTLLGRPTPFVGRDRELRALDDLFSECVEENIARAALVTAPSGMGKSRLRHEFLSGLRARRERVEIWLARGDPLSAGSAFAMLGSALASAAGLSHGEPLEERRQKVFARVARHVPGPERARVAAFLGEILGAPFPDEHSELVRAARQSAGAMADQIRRAFCDFIAAESRAHPVVLVLEDLHWGDAPSASLIDAVLVDRPDSAFMVLALGRPEIYDLFPRLWAQRNMQGIRLSGLARRAAERLARHVLSASVDEARLEQIVERAEGNPFYLEEMLRVVAEGHSGALPETVLAMVQARLDTLPSAERRVLRAASVFGEAAWRGGIAALLGEGDSDAQVRAEIDALVEQEILVRRKESRFSGEAELTFRHALLRDGAYALLTEADRALGHSLAAEWLVEMGEESALLLAEHFERGREPARAASYRLVAAQRSLFGNDFQAAIAQAERAYASFAGAEERLKRAHILEEALWFQGELSRADAYADEILSLAPAGSEPWCSALEVKTMLGAELGSTERVGAAVLALSGAEVTADNVHLLLQVHGTLVFLFSLTGPRELAEQYLEAARRMAEGLSLDPKTGWFLATAETQWSFVFSGDFGAALAANERARDYGRRAGDHRWEAFSHGLYGWLAHTLGAFDVADAELRSAIEGSHVTGLAALIGRVVLSWVLTLRGAAEEGEAYALRAMEHARGNGFAEGMGRTALAYALFRRGDVAAAAEQVDAALGQLFATPLLRTITLALAAAVRLAEGRASAALALCREALGADEPPRIYPAVEIWVRLGEAEALAALGDRDAATSALARARGRLLALASTIGDEGLRASYLTKMPWNARTLALAEEWTRSLGEGR